MSKRQQSGSPEMGLLNKILYVNQQAFILQALQAGMSTEAIRKILKIDYWKVIEISKHFKLGQKKFSRQSNKS